MGSEIMIAAMQAVQAGIEYLDRRKGSAQSAVENDLIEDWQEALKKAGSHLAAEPGEAVEEHGVAPRELESIRQRIQGFHEWSAIDEIDSTFGTLHDRLVMLAGPHGPGGGRPRRPRGPGGLGG